MTMGCWMRRVAALTTALAFGVWIHGVAIALDESPVPASSPGAAAPPPPPPESMSVVPAEGESPAANPTASPKPKTSASKPKSAAPATTSASTSLEVEATEAKLRIKDTADAWIYAKPSKSAKKIKRAEPGKFINVTGSTRYYLQVQLKDGQTGYLSPSAVDLTKPTDKIFMLSKDAGVLDAPNKWGKKVAEVHQGHNVQVTGIALNYLQIKMKSGLVGYIPMTAVQ